MRARMQQQFHKDPSEPRQRRKRKNIFLKETELINNCKYDQLYVTPLLTQNIKAMLIFKNIISFFEKQTIKRVNGTRENDKQ